MSKLTCLAAELYRENENVIRSIPAGFPAHRVIEVSYDLQSGSYIRDLTIPGERDIKIAWGNRLAGILREYKVRSVCEAGVGEATTLAFVSKAAPEIEFAGFDLSLSRLLFARRFLTEEKTGARLFCALMNEIPFPDNSVDTIVTNHSLEPNGGREELLLAELIRIASRYVILIEPDYEKASPEQRSRMARHNYARNLRDHLRTFPGRIIRDEPWPLTHNPLNMASLIVFEKNADSFADSLPDFVSPLNRLPLNRIDNFYHCAEEGLLYPAAFDIPVLREDAAIVCFFPETDTGLKR